MDKKDKMAVFQLMLKNFETDVMKNYFNDMVCEIPDYMFTMPASTSGKYHNAKQCEKFGQIYHEYMFSEILNYLLNLKHNKETYCLPIVRDCMRCVPVFHDSVKCGLNKSKYTVSEHPVLAAEWVRTTKVEHDIPSQFKEIIANMCESHSGEWNKDRGGNVIMSEPRNEMEFLIHECDILSSRYNLDYVIPDELNSVLEKLDV